MKNTNKMLILLMLAILVLAGCKPQGSPLPPPMKKAPG